MATQIETWDLWFPAAAARGLSFARGRLDAAETLLVHAPPDLLDVDVWTDDGSHLARGTGLARTADSPIARLTRHQGEIKREDIWPADADLGLPVMLPGGEVGILKEWWNDAERRQWRWSVEFYNHV